MPNSERTGLRTAVGPRKCNQVPESQKSEGLNDLATPGAQYRKAILRQYDLPDIKVGVFRLLRWATPFEAVLMMLGILAAIASGTAPAPYLSKIEGLHSH